MTTIEIYGPKEHEFDFIARCQPQAIYSWERWLERWRDRALTTDERVGLLHFMPMSLKEAIPFLLELIDERHHLFHRDCGGYAGNDCSLKLIQKKALSVLIQKVFKLGPEDMIPNDDDEPWYTIIQEPQSLEKILAFYERDFFSYLLPKGHENVIAEQFLDVFVKLLRTHRSNQQLDEFINAETLRIFRVIIKHGLTSHLTDSSRPFFNLAATMNLLKTLATETTDSSVNQKPSDLLDAIATNDYRAQAAELWFTLNVRLKLIRRRERRERNRSKLNKLKADQARLEERICTKA